MEIAVPRFALDKCVHMCVCARAYMCVHVCVYVCVCRWMCEGDTTFTHISPLTHRLPTVMFNTLISYNVRMLIPTKALYL